MPYADPARQNAYQARRLAKRRERWLEENGPCAQCGSAEDLEVDHVDPDKKVSHRVWSWTPARATAELAKCQVLCGACHRAKTNAQIARPLVHGTRGAYRKGCRCDTCRESNRRYMAEWRSARFISSLDAEQNGCARMRGD